MSLKEWADKQVIVAAENKARADCTGSFEGITLKPWTITHKRTSGPVAGAMARVESGSDIRRRRTATRLLISPIIGLLAKKQVGHMFLTVEGAGFEFMVEVAAKKESDARKFASKINNAAKRQT